MADATVNEVTYEGDTTLVQELFPILVDFANKYNDARARWQSKGSGDTGVGKQRREWLRNTDNERVVQLRKAMDQARKELNELAAQQFPGEAGPDEDEVKAAKEEAKTFKEQYKAVLSTIEGTLNSPAGAYIVPDADKVRELLNSVTLDGQSASPTTGISRPRVTVTDVVAGRTYKSISEAAQNLKGVSGQDIKTAYAAACGADVADLSKFNDQSTTFEVKGIELRTDPKPAAKSAA